MTGKPILPANSRPSFRLFTSADLGTSRPIFCIASLKKSRSSGFLDGSDVCADEKRVVFVEHAAIRSSTARFKAVCPPTVGRMAKPALGESSRSMRMISSEILASERLNVSAVGDLGIGHDGRRIRVRKHYFVALGLEAPCRPACPSSRTRRTGQ
mgnify:CR=1 FL=1